MIGRENPPEYARTVDINTLNAIKYMVGPNTVTIVVPLIPGFCLVPSPYSKFDRW